MKAMHDLMKDYFRLLDEAAQVEGFNDVDWSIVCRESEVQPSELWFSVVGYIHMPAGAVKHILHGGPDMATAIQGCQGKLRQARSEMTNA